MACWLLKLSLLKQKKEICSLKATWSHMRYRRTLTVQHWFNRLFKWVKSISSSLSSSLCTSDCNIWLFRPLLLVKCCVLHMWCVTYMQCGGEFKISPGHKWCQCSNWTCLSYPPVNVLFIPNSLSEWICRQLLCERNVFLWCALWKVNDLIIQLQCRHRQGVSVDRSLNPWLHLYYYRKWVRYVLWPGSIVIA